VQRAATIGSATIAGLAWLLLLLAFVDAGILSHVPLYAGLLPLLSLGLAAAAWLRFHTRALLIICGVSLLALGVEIFSIVHLFNTFNSLQQYKP
jgi:hypothetical protein